jgi:predicted phage tail protein
MATCAVSGTIVDITETAIQSVAVKARLITPIFSSTNFIVPKEVSTTTAANGTWTLNLSRLSTCEITIEYPPNTTDSVKKITYVITVPDSASANFSSLATEL